MTKIRLKFYIFLGMVAVGGFAAALGIMLLTQFVAAFQQGADPASIFHGNKLVVPEVEQAHWDVDTFTTITPTAAQREEILAAYWNAWEALKRAHETGKPNDLATYWAGDAIQQSRQSVVADFQLNHAGHQLSLTFFSDDGSVVAFQDRLFQLEYIGTESTIKFQASATVVMTLDNGFWRIRLLRLNYD